MRILSLFILLISYNSLAQNESASRKDNVDYKIYVNRYLNSMTQKNLNSPIRKARSLRTFALNKATAWRNSLLMQERFEQLRDMRFLITHSSGPDMLRRISWLYPDDGCFARAGLFNRNAFRMFIPIPNKIFAFGNLKINTPYSPKGYVSWWYHVAPVVQIGEEKFVLDPAIEQASPLTLDEWVKRMGDPSKIKVSICSSGTYSPGDNCEKMTNGMELRAEKSQLRYLDLEWKRIKNLGLDPDQVLGDNPPW